MKANERDSENSDYRYDEDAEGHENQLEFDRDYATYDALQEKGLIDPEMEEKIREDLEQDRPDHQSTSSVEGRHTNQGSRDHERPDSHMEEEANKRLTVHREIDAVNIRVSVQNAEITLEGTVDSRATKRLAEDVLETILGMQDIHNHLRIKSS